MSDVIVVSERRRSWPDELKLQILAEAALPGENVCRVARRHEIDPAQIYQWRKKFRAEEEPSATLMPVEVVAETPVATPHPAIEHFAVKCVRLTAQEARQINKLEPFTDSV